MLGLAVRPQGEISLAADGPDADQALASLAEKLGPFVMPVTGRP